jgi:spermidine synthase
VVEIDPKLRDIAKQYFNYRDHPNVTIIAADARTFVNSNQKKYDIIVADVYNGISVPFPLATTEYVQKVQGSLRPHGVVLANFIGSNTSTCGPMLGALHTTYSQSFSEYRVFPQIEKTLSRIQNVVVLYANEPLDSATDDPLSHELMPHGRVLHDNFAPVERLEQNCHF